MESKFGNDAARGRDAQLVRAVGLFALAAAVINVIVGGGIFRLPSSVYGELGTAGPVAFLVGAIAIIPITLCFASAGSRVSSTGGVYSYVEAAYGPFMGFIAGALLWVCNFSSSAGIAVALSDQVARVLPAVGEPAGRALFLAAVYGFLIALNAFGVKLGARAIVVLASIKLTPLILLATIGLFFVDWNQVTFFALPSLGALGASLITVMFAYSGVETALTPSGEVRDPSRDVPRATLAAIAIVVLLYLAIQIVAQGLVGPDLIRPDGTGDPTPLATAAGRIWTPGYTLLLVAAGISMLGFLMGNLLGSSRVVYALGRDGYLPAVAGHITAKHRVPLVAVCLHAGVAWTLANWPGSGFDFLVRMSSGANCLLYIAVALAAIVLERRNHREHGEPFRMPGGTWFVPLVATFLMAAILTTLPAAEWSAILIGVAVLVVIYAGLRVLKGRRAPG